VRFIVTLLASFLDFWSESSWNIRANVLGTFAPQERKFQGANVPWNESSTGAKVQGNEKSIIRESLQGCK